MGCLKLNKSVGLLTCAAAVLSLSSLPVHGVVASGSPSQTPIVGLGEQATVYADSGGHSGAGVPVIREGESLTIYRPHHSGDAAHNDHYFAQTGDAHHFGWFSSTPSSPGPIVVKYDFRSEGGFTNLITAGQKANAIAALSAWSAATSGKLTFTLDTVASASSIINIGTGDLAALGSTSGSGGVLGLGGGFFAHNPAPTTHAITNGVAWQDFADTWDETIGNGNPGGTFDYFTVVAQEIGHALGLGHTIGADIMNGSYTGELTALSAVDVAHITSIYGTIPEPTSMILLGASAMLVFGRRRRA